MKIRGGLRENRDPSFLERLKHMKNPGPAEGNRKVDAREKGNYAVWNTTE